MTLSLDPTVVDGFLAAAGAHPGRTAIAADGRRLSYAALLARVRAVARRLGPRPGVVAVPASHTPATIAGLLGVWLAGGAYCPVDPAFPAARQQAMAAAAGVEEGAPTGDPAPVGDPSATPADLAYVLFTSGSTGEPKPVLTPQSAIAAAVPAVRELFDLTSADRVLQFASLNWDTCFEEILPTLTSGACLVFHPDAYAGSFPRLLRMLDRERITVLNLPTAFWHELVGYLREAVRETVRDGGKPLPASLRLVIIGGEPVSPARLADWCALPAGGGPRLLNTYGCTETTLITHAAELPGPETAGWDPARPVPIGRPLPHVLEHLTDQGELLVGGPSLAAGYRGLPAETAARFVTVGPTRFFRTGDRVSRLPDGSLVPAGRIDQQLKVRGIRVDPAEVEAHIAAHPAVGAVAVTGVRVADHTVLAAYVIAAGSADPAGLPASIVEHLRGRVPEHLVPSRIRIVDRLAYTATGKLDRLRLEEAL